MGSVALIAGMAAAWTLLPALPDAIDRVRGWRATRRMKGLVRAGLRPGPNNVWEQTLEGRRVTVLPRSDLATFRLEVPVQVRRVAALAGEASLAPTNGLARATGGVDASRTSKADVPAPLRFERGPGDHPIGDPPFDAAVSMRGPRAEALALLTPELRAALARAIPTGWRFEEDVLPSLVRGARVGRLVLEVSAIAAISDRAREGVELASAVERATPPTTSEGLYHRVATDPAPAVRQAALEALIKHFEPNLERPWLEPALALARRDPAPELRLFVALRERDVPALQALSRSSPEAIRAQARAALESIVAQSGGADPRGALSLASTEGHLAVVPEPD